MSWHWLVVMRLVILFCLSLCPLLGATDAFLYPVHNLVVLIDESTGGKDVVCWRGLGVCHAGEAHRLVAVLYWNFSWRKSHYAMYMPTQPCTNFNVPSSKQVDFNVM